MKQSVIALKELKLYQQISSFYVKHPVAVSLIGWLILTMVGALVFYLRFPFNYSHPNFYAEDGTILVRNIILEGPVVGMFSLFNGYLVLGQYLITEVAFVVNGLFGSGFYSLPKAIAVVSYSFWGAVASLPFLLFRKKLGLILTLITVALLYIVPLGGYDYAVIGTIGNLKFAFFFVATLLIVYRNQLPTATKTWQFIFVDLVLLLCVFTNIIVVALLPFALWRYRADIVNLFKRKFSVLRQLSIGHYSLITLLVISAIYPALVYIRGLPSMEGYLDGPLQVEALLDILYRGSVYGITFPVNSLINDVIVIFMFALVVYGIVKSKYRHLLLFLSYAVVINVLGFALTRPGITELFQEYRMDGGPGLFFYAGTLIFVFGLAYIFKDRFKGLSVNNKLSVAAIVFVFCLIAVSASGLRSSSYESILLSRPTVNEEVDRVCDKPFDGADVELGINPAPTWTLSLPAKDVCAKW